MNQFVKNYDFNKLIYFYISSLTHKNYLKILSLFDINERAAGHPFNASEVKVLLVFIKYLIILFITKYVFPAAI